MILSERFSGWLTVNRKCNLRCKWCYAKSTEFATKDMSLEIVDKAVRIYSGLNVNSIVLIGGEPTIHPHFIEIVKKIESKGMRPLLVTNGVELADMIFLRRLKDAGVKAITVSIKAFTEKDYLDNTGRKVFTQVIKGMQNVNKLDILNKLSITLCKHLIGKTDEMIEAVKMSNTPSFSLDMGRPVINQQNCEVGDMSPRDMAEHIVKIYPKLDKCGINFTIKFSIPFCLFPEGFVAMLREKNRIISGCQIYKGSGVIFDPDGNLLPCNHFCLHPMGKLNVDFSTAKEYIKFRSSPQIQEFYKKVSSCNDIRCVECEDWKYCGAGCRVNWLAYSSADLIGKTQERR